jgi:hypothetical protein
VSFDVWTEMATLPAVALPIVKPLSVTMNALAASMTAPDTLSTTDLWVIEPLEIFSKAPALAETSGVMEGTKKFGG